MKVVKSMLIVNAATLVINGVIVWLTIVKSCPAVLGIALVIGFLSGSVWVSCAVNGKLPRKAAKYHFYSAPTQKVERI